MNPIALTCIVLDRGGCCWLQTPARCAVGESSQLGHSRHSERVVGSARRQVWVPTRTIWPCVSGERSVSTSWMWSRPAPGDCGPQAPAGDREPQRDQFDAADPDALEPGDLHIEGSADSDRGRAVEHHLGHCPERLHIEEVTPSGTQLETLSTRRSRARRAAARQGRGGFLPRGPAEGL